MLPILYIFLLLIHQYFSHQKRLSGGVHTKNWTRFLWKTNFCDNSYNVSSDESIPSINILPLSSPGYMQVKAQLISLVIVVLPQPEAPQRILALRAKSQIYIINTSTALQYYKKRCIFSTTILFIILPHYCP